MTNIKDFEGSIPVDGDVTPTTRQKVEQLDSTSWAEMSISELQNQRMILSNRMAQASSVGQHGIYQQLQRGLTALDGLIYERGYNLDSGFL